MKTKIIGAILAILVITLVIVSYFSKKTHYNEEGTLGNSSCNLFNGGLFCEFDQKIYFSNPEDEGRLYVMDLDLSNYKKLSSDTANYINVAGSYIFYARHNDLQSKSTENVFALSKTGLYRIDLNGRNTKTLFNNAVGVVTLSGNDILYQKNTDTGFGVSSISIDKKQEKELIDQPIFPYAIDNNYLYYVGVRPDHNIHVMNLKDATQSTLVEGNFAYLATCGGYLYYLDLEKNHSLCRMELDGSKSETLIEEPTSTYNVTPDNKYIYYQLDNSDDSSNNGIYLLDLNSKKSTLITLGNFCKIHTTSKYTFFQAFDKERYYVMETGSTNQPQEFLPKTKKK